MSSSSLRPISSGFVGRKRELAQLLAGLARAREGVGAIFALTGVAGIGKSRLAQEFARLAGEAGARTWWGRGRTGGHPLQLWMELVRDSVEGTHLEGNEYRMLDQEAFISDEDGVISGSEKSPDLGLVKTVEFLRNVSRFQPLVLIIDDAHEVHPLSLLLLRLATRELSGASVVFVVAYRDLRMQPSAALTEFAEELSSAGNRPIEVGSLGRDEVRDWVATANEQVDEALADSIFERSGGNPIFVEFLMRDLRRDGSIPKALDAPIWRGLGSLSKSAKRLLTIAALIGREFDLGILRAVSQATTEQIADAVAEGEINGLVKRAERSRHNYRFIGQLCWEALRDVHRGAARARLHRSIGNALETASARAGALPLQEMAHHFFEGAVLGEGSKAVEYSRRAAEKAFGEGRFEDATRLYQMALSGMDLCGADEERTCDLLLALGEAQFNSVDHAASRRTFRRAADLAEWISDPRRLARAALGHARQVWPRLGLYDGETISLLKRSLESLRNADDDPLRVQVSICLYLELTQRGDDNAWRSSLLQGAVETAQRSGDKQALLATLRVAELDRSGAGWQQEEWVSATEMLGLAQELGSADDCSVAFARRCAFFLRRSDLVRADREAFALNLATEVVRQPYLNWASYRFRATRALMVGQFEAGESLARQALAISEQKSQPNACELFWVPMLEPLCMLGRIGELEPMARRTADQRPSVPAYRALLGRICCSLQNLSEARAIFESLAVDNFSYLPHDDLYEAGLAALADVCFELRDRSRAASLYELLLPRAETNLVFGPLAFFGPASRYLGLLAMVMQDFGKARLHFEDAIETTEKSGAQPWLALTLYDLATMLAETAESIDRAEALQTLSSALAIAEPLGMNDLVRRGSLLKQQLEAEHPAGNATSTTNFRHGVPADKRPCESLSMARIDAASSPSIYRREGDYWTVVFDNKTLRLKDSKGSSCIAYLLQHPGREYHCCDLAIEISGGRAVVERVVGDRSDVGRTMRTLGDAGSMLDAKAKSSYRTRILELREELEEATSFQDFGRKSKIEQELVSLTNELSRAVGLGGHDRKLSSDSERARIRVTNAVKATIKKIRREHPSLGRYLAGTIKTGTFCRFDPDPRFPDAWQF